MIVRATKLHSKPVYETMMPNEKSIVQRCQAGDEEAFALLFKQYRQRLYGLAASILQDEAAAEDAVQETFLTVLDKIKSYRQESALETWLIAILVNQCRSHLRWQKARRALSLENLTPRWLARLAGREMDPATAVADNEQAETVWRLVNRLDNRLRIPIILRYQYELSAAEIAEILGSNPNRVYQQLHEGRRQLHLLARP
jgi:RNA polymerase sigma-70 factor, ECF subfamily